jgi:hypothetical protein
VAAIWLWARTDWRNRWPSLVGLALLIALAGGVALGVAGGARRAATAVDRWKAATNWHEVEVELTDSEDGERPPQVPGADTLADEIAAVPGVRGVSVLTWIGVTPDPDADFFAAALGADRGAATQSAVVRGRLPDPAAADEIVINETGLDEWAAEVGGTLTLQTLGPHQWDQFVGRAPYDPEGPLIDVRVVGVIRDLESITDRPEAFLITSPAFLDRWSGEVISVTGIAAVNTDPARADEVVNSLEGVGGGLFHAGPVDEDYASRITDTIDVEVTALWAFAAAAAVAGLVIVGQALLRHVARGAAEQHALAAMGLGPRQRALGSLLAVAPALAGGCVAALVLAVGLSPIFPRGLARQAEIDLGVRVDAEVLVIGGAALGACLILVALAAGWFAARAGAAAPAGRPGRGERMLGALPIVPALGARLTLAQSLRGAGPAWAGAGAVAVGVAGLLAVTTVDRSVDQLLAAPALYGAPWDLEAGLDAGEPGAADALAADPDVEMVATQRMLAIDDGVVRATGPTGAAEVEPFTFDVELGTVPLVVDEGREPGPGEVAVGSEVLDRLGAGVGDTIRVEGFDGDVPLTVVGRTVSAGNDELDQGFYVPPETFDELLADCEPGDEDERCRADVHGLGVRLRPGADASTAYSRLQAIQPSLEPTPRPSVVDSLAEIGSTPQWLGGFLALLGLAGLAHALLTSGRRTRHDLAVARALGLRPRQAARAVRWGAVLMTVAGVALGVLLGLVAGRLVWQHVVLGVGAILETEVSLAALLLVPLAALAVSLLVAIVPGRRAASLHPGAVLRAE